MPFRQAICQSTAYVFVDFNRNEKLSLNLSGATSIPRPSHNLSPAENSSQNMSNPSQSTNSGRIVGYSMLLTAAFSFAVIVATFLLSNSELSFNRKALIFIAIAVLYPICCAFFYYWQRGRIADAGQFGDDTTFTPEIEAKLMVLEEANEFFGASLKFSDMFRLVTSRINELVPFSTAIMMTRGKGENVLGIVYATGEKARGFMDLRADMNRGLAVKSFLSGQIQIDHKLLYERRVLPPELVDDFSCAAAVPLKSAGETYGVLVMYTERESGYEERETKLLNAIGERIAPLFKNSFAFEENISSALTDGLTSLPNERGFYLVLENQVAESLRFRDERPLTVLAMDIRNFDEVNRRHGHATGDRMLGFAANLIKKQLRQMDVLTRSAGDEFLAILPTASEKIAIDVIGRIQRAFVLNKFEVSSRERVNLEVNFGAATFWKEGETAAELVKTARLKKLQDKSNDKSKVIWFPKEFVN